MKNTTTEVRRSKYDEYKAEVSEAYGFLQEGESKRTEICPKCKGGSAHEPSFSVSKRDGGLLFNCFRASCGFRGRTGVQFNTARADGGARQNARAHTTNNHREPPKVSALSDAAKGTLGVRYGLAPEEVEALGWGITSEDRLFIPLRGWDGSDLGYVGRRLGEGLGPKALTRSNTPDAMAWYPKGGSDKLIIVEDIFSAVRASKYENAVALLGTHMNQARADAIKEFVGSGTVYLCLDADAFNKAIKLAFTFKNTIPSLKVKKLSKDIKDLDETSLQYLIEDIRKL